jgi:hypothetical protein
MNFKWVECIVTVSDSRGAVARGDIFGLTELKAHDSGVMRLHTWSLLNLKMTLSYIHESRNIVCNDMIFLLLD